MNAKNLISILPSLVKCIPAAYIKEQRWFGSKSQDITEVELCDAAIFSHRSNWYALTLIRMTYENNETEMYVLPLAFIKTNAVVSMDRPVITMLEMKSIEGNYAVFDALSDDEFCRLQLDYIKSSMTVKALEGRFNFLSTPVFTETTGEELDLSQVSLAHLKTEQSNTSVIYENAFIMKNFRKLSYGINPDLEIPLFLTTRTGFRNIARVAGYIEYTDNNNLKTSIASLQTFIPNEGDGWSYTLEHLKKFYDFALQHDSATGLDQSANDGIEPIVQEFFSHYLSSMHRLGQVTGELHVALASDAAEPDFTPEEITPADVTLWVSRIRSYGTEVISGLQNAAKSFPPQIEEQLRKVSDNISLYLLKSGDLAVLAEQKIWKTRYHNDYHLGQVLKTGNDFVIIDFEGEPARPLEERKQKQSPLKDVAGMLRSFNYAVYATIFNMKLESDRMIILEMWGRVWEELVKKSYLDGYLVATGGTGARFLPDSEEAILKVLSVFQMDKAIYELNYELNNRPTWVGIPLKYLTSLLE